MIDLLIWSKDRACQLELLLRSLPQDLFDDISIVYTSTNINYKCGYSKLKEKYSYVTFLEEGSFRNLTLDVMSASANKKNLIALSTDDTVFFANPKVSASDIQRVFTADTIAFSFRYGYNTVVQNCHTKERQSSLNIVEENGDFIKWNFEDYHPLSNYGYPFGLDMHVYNANIIHDLSSFLQWSNTNQLESRLFEMKQFVPKMIFSERNSSAVNIPCNNMSGFTMSGKDFSLPIEYLNDHFLNGYIIDLLDIQSKSHTIVGSHQELDLKLIKE